MRKIIFIILAAVLVLGLSSCSGSSSDSEYDDAMAGYDWGDGYYYDSNDNAVKKTLW